MDATSLLRDYGSAIGAAVSRKRCSGISVLVEMLYARLRFDIGPLYYSLFCLDQKPVDTWGDYVLDREVSAILRTINTPDGRALVTDKLSFDRKLKAGRFPTIPILAILAEPGQSFSSEGLPVIYTAEQFAALSGELPERIFFKTIDGAHGEGAFVASRHGGRWAFAGTQGSVSDLFAHCQMFLAHRRGWLLQERVTAHAALLSTLCPNALGTARIVTARCAGSVSILAAAFKIPVGESVTDNFSEGASGNIVAPVGLRTGTLGLGQMSTNKHWPEMTAVERHPDTGCMIPGFQLPHWSRALSLVTEIQQELEEAPTLGWDVALTDAGPLVVEANAGYAVELHEVAEQRGMRSTFSCLRDAVAGRLATTAA